MADHEGRFESVEAVAEQLLVDVQTVRRWIKSGKLKAYRPGREYRILSSDLEEFLETRAVDPKEPAPAWPRPAEERRKAEAFLTAHPDEGGRTRLIEQVARTHQRWADSWYLQAERYEEEGVAPYGRALEAEAMHGRLTAGPAIGGLAAYVNQVRKGERAVSERETAACEKSDEEAGRLGHAMMYMRGINAEALEKAEAEAEFKTLDSLLEESLASGK